MHEITSFAQYYQKTLNGLDKVQVVGIFSSCALNHAKEESDLNLPLEILRPVNLVEIVEVKLNSSDLLGAKAGLVLKRSLLKEPKETRSSAEHLSACAFSARLPQQAGL
ncbi:hypothetical protein M15_04940 [Atrimonas thermophila]